MSTLFFVTATWCGHCLSIKNEKVIEKCRYALRGADIGVVEVDVDEQPKTAEVLGVKAYPSIILLKNNGDKLFYEGARKSSDITAWVCNNT